MKKIASFLAVAVAAVLVTLGYAPAAHAYPDIDIDLTASPQVLYGGQSFTATGTSNVTCAWTLTWNTVVRQGGGNKYVTSYTAPQVTKITKIPLDGTCLYTPPPTGDTSARTTAPLASWHRTILITVLPRGSAAPPPASHNGDLPNTGGPNPAFLVGGLLLLLAGSTAVTVARRRAADGELPGQTA
ncbi:MAG: hypothetical protein JWP74_1605 [Marmoricola sp.]|nr:hypothetical protein [Marmoricola sp.]